MIRVGIQHDSSHVITIMVMLGRWSVVNYGSKYLHYAYVYESHMEFRGDSDRSSV